ncbi:MAG: hypothetical protein SNF33_08315 [Candidatus Algichlamydia australiensis]|nr:hypothetical protein [Chlamydiales bacterium]
MLETILRYPENLLEPPDFKSLFTSAQALLVQLADVQIENCKNTIIKRMPAKEPILNFDVWFPSKIRDLDILRDLEKSLTALTKQEFAKSIEQLGLKIYVSFNWPRIRWSR